MRRQPKFRTHAPVRVAVVLGDDLGQHPGQALDVRVLQVLRVGLEEFGEPQVQRAVDALGVQDHRERHPHHLLPGGLLALAQQRRQVAKVVLDLVGVGKLVLGVAGHPALQGLGVEPLGVGVQVGLGAGLELLEERLPDRRALLEHPRAPRVRDGHLDPLLARLHRGLVEVAGALPGHLLNDGGANLGPVRAAGLPAGDHSTYGVGAVLHLWRREPKLALGWGGPALSSRGKKIGG